MQSQQIHMVLLLVHATFGNTVTSSGGHAGTFWWYDCNRRGDHTKSSGEITLTAAAALELPIK